jgi:hypothetical protein
VLDVVCSFFLGLLIGSLSVGAVTWRQISVYDGQPLHTLMSSSVISITYAFGVNFVVEQDWVGYVGFALGAAFVTSGMAFRQKLKNEERERDGQTEPAREA